MLQTQFLIGDIGRAILTQFALCLEERVGDLHSAIPLPISLESAPCPS